MEEKKRKKKQIKFTSYLYNLRKRKQINESKQKNNEIYATQA